MPFSETGVLKPGGKKAEWERLPLSLHQSSVLAGVVFLYYPEISFCFYQIPTGFPIPGGDLIFKDVPWAIQSRLNASGFQQSAFWLVKNRNSLLDINGCIFKGRKSKPYGGFSFCPNASWEQVLKEVIKNIRPDTISCHNFAHLIVL
ncbi:MAG: hypothetical protein HFE39_08900 [Clostridiales bacterium]|nr:hypothetical protein [Clostridiales bacterium]